MPRLGLIAIIITCLNCSSIEQNPASLDRIRVQQTKLLFTSCMRDRYEVDAQTVYGIGDLSHTCREWARETVKGPYDS